MRIELHSCLCRTVRSALHQYQQ